MIFEIHDNSSWTEQRDLLYSFLATAVYGLTADGQAAELVLDQFDDHSVNINVPGEYEILISYSLADSCQNRFTLPDDLKTWHIPVKVSDPSVYELWTLKVDNSAFYVTSLTKPASDAKLFWLKSESKLTEKELSTQNWEVFPDPDDGTTLNPYLSDFQISRTLLTRGIYHYFQVVSSTQRSTILMIQDNGEEYNYENTGGDRDGSSSDDAHQLLLPPVRPHPRVLPPGHRMLHPVPRLVHPSHRVLHPVPPQPLHPNHRLLHPTPQLLRPRHRLLHPTPQLLRPIRPTLLPRSPSLRIRIVCMVSA